MPGVLEPGPQADIPDYSQSERSAVPEAYRWRLEDIYPTVAAWQSEMTEARRDLGRLESLLQGCAGGSRRLADCLELHEVLSRRLAKLAGYASLQSQVQWSNARFQDMQAEANQVQTTLDALTGTLDACVLQADERKLAKDSRGKRPPDPLPQPPATGPGRQGPQPLGRRRAGRLPGRAVLGWSQGRRRLPAMPICGHEDLDYRHACMVAYNRWLRDYCSHAPDRLYGAGLAAVKNAAQGQRSWWKSAIWASRQ